MAHIAVLQTENSPPIEDTYYLCAHLISIWREHGHKVTILQGTNVFVPADLLFCHIDLTVMPDDYIEFIERYPASLNGSVRDISKDRYSSLMLERNQHHDGPVIVKTRANYGGRVDLRYEFSRSGQSLELDLHERPWRKVESLDPYDYPVFDSVYSVPAGVWKNPRLMVEKFVSERMPNGDYSMRQWMFCGDASYSRRLGSAYRIIKPFTGEPVPGRETWIEPLEDDDLPELRAIRENLKLDFGRFDYVVADGRAQVFDANVTPVVAQATVDAIGADRMRAMALTVENYL